MGKVGRVAILVIMLAALGGCQLSNPRIFVTHHPGPMGPVPQPGTDFGVRP